jgi:hypothetical protein
MCSMNKHLTVDFPAKSRVVYRMFRLLFSRFGTRTYDVEGSGIFPGNLVTYLQDHILHAQFL